MKGKKPDLSKQPVIGIQQKPALCAISQKQTAGRSKHPEDESMPAIPCTSVGMHGLIAPNSKNLMDSSLSCRHTLHFPYINTYLATSSITQNCSPQLHAKVLPTIARSSIFVMISRDNSSMDSDKGASVQFQDFLPVMARRLGVEGLMQELCKGFQLLMEPRAGKITFRSLKQNAARLGLGQLRDDELLEMMKEGDMDGDGALDQMEFCILMVRLSPELMEEEAHMMFQH